MKIQINIEEDIFRQFSNQLNANEKFNSLDLDSSIGEGKINLLRFPNLLEFYHFTFKLNKELELNSTNSKHSEYFLLNINLSEKAVEKKMNGKEINIQKYLPSGILYYPPNVDVYSKSPVNTPFEIVLIKFHKDLLTTYFPNEEDVFFNFKDTIIYEDLDFKSEELLKEIIVSTNKIESHSKILAFLSNFFDKLRRRETNLKYENLHPEDVKQLFLAASFLRNPTSTDTPTIEELAKISKMGKTKFKNVFRQVFGSAPKQYHQKVKMEYAKEELRKKQKNSTELSYELGYAHPSKFTRAFKKYFGDTPSKI